MQAKRYVTAAANIGGVFKRIGSHLLAVMLMIFLLMIVISILMYVAENEAQPEVFANALSGFRWSVAAFIGHGGVFPVTVFGKVLTMIFAGLRICFISTIIGVTVAGFAAKARDDRVTEKESAQFCPHCGKDMDK